MVTPSRDEAGEVHVIEHEFIYCQAVCSRFQEQPLLNLCFWPARR